MIEVTCTNSPPTWPRISPYCTSAPTTLMTPGADDGEPHPASASDATATATATATALPHERNRRDLIGIILITLVGIIPVNKPISARLTECRRRATPISDAK